MTTKKTKAVTGRPTAFKPEYVEQVEKLCKLGATDKDLADFFGVTEQTINNWKLAEPLFFESLKRGKMLADANVASALYHRATGYSHEAVKIFNHEGVPLEVPYVEHYPPDPTSMIFWLKNRRPDLWRSNRDADDTGKQEAQPVSITVEVKDARKDAES